MFRTKKADWYFIIPATLVWASALFVSALNFIRIRHTTHRFGFLNLIGLGSMLVGIAIRLRARMTLGKYFSAGLRTLDKHELVKHGIYSHVRHPAYTGNFLFWFGIPLLFSSLYGFLIMLLLIPCFLYRIKIEESMLIEKFGSEYVEYMKRTKKLLPCLY
jgi:protein-S-isoprenylcysteine O-methyltransferase Ste14